MKIPNTPWERGALRARQKWERKAKLAGWLEEAEKFIKANPETTYNAVLTHLGISRNQDSNAKEARFAVWRLWKTK